MPGEWGKKAKRDHGSVCHVDQLSWELFEGRYELFFLLKTRDILGGTVEDTGGKDAPLGFPRASLSRFPFLQGRSSTVRP